MKNAGDLREAMDVTEISAARTIQDLEMINANQQEMLDRLEKILGDSQQDEMLRIENALNILDQR